MSRLASILKQITASYDPIDELLKQNYYKTNGSGMKNQQTHQGIFFDDDHTIHLMASDDFGLIIDGKQKQVHWIGQGKSSDEMPAAFKWHEGWKKNYGKLQ